MVLVEKLFRDTAVSPGTAFVVICGVDVAKVVILCVFINVVYLTVDSIFSFVEAVCTSRGCTTGVVA